MFKIFIKSNDTLVIYKSVMIDAAVCITKNTDSITTVEAEAAISDMLIEMDLWFGEDDISDHKIGRIVKLQYLKSKDSDYVELTSMNSFKIWLIRMQQSKECKLILSKLKEYCRKKGSPLPKLNIVFGDFDRKQIYNTDVYFRNSYIADWLRPEIIKKAVRDIDKSEVIDNLGDLDKAKNASRTSITINSPVFGIMPPEKLSGGIKTLILIYNNPEMVFNASTCGDNCAKWIERFANPRV